MFDQCQLWRSARRCGWALTLPVTVAGQDQPGGGVPRHTPPLGRLARRIARKKDGDVVKSCLLSEEKETNWIIDYGAAVLFCH